MYEIKIKLCTVNIFAMKNMYGVANLQLLKNRQAQLVKVTHKLNGTLLLFNQKIEYLIELKNKSLW